MKNIFFAKKIRIPEEQEAIQADLDKVWVEMQALLESGVEAREVVFKAMWETGAVYLKHLEDLASLKQTV